jgi:hypothetical protein
VRASDKEDPMDEKLKGIYMDIEAMFSHFLSICPIHCEEKIKVFLASKQHAQRLLFELANPKDRTDPEKDKQKDIRMRDVWKKRKTNT